MKIGQIGIGRKLYERKSGMQFRIAAQDHYGSGITTLLCEHVIGVRALDAAEPERKCNSLYEASDQFGSNHYPTSNLNAYLNSDKIQWYEPKHKFDCPPDEKHTRYGEFPYEQEPGFLLRFSEEMRENLVFTEIPVLVRTGRGTAELKSLNAAVFLPSRTEMNKGNELGIPEGKPLPIFYDHYIFKAVPAPEQLEKYGRLWQPEEPEKGLYYDIAQMYDPKFGWWYYMRTPNTMYSFLQRVMSPYGSVSYTYAYNDDVGIRPLINIRADMEAADVGVAEPVYRIG